MDNKTMYEEDFYLWIRTTINQLQARQFERVDLENLLEELASMGRSDTFPVIPIGSLEQILDEDWFPAGDNLEI